MQIIKSDFQICIKLTYKKGEPNDSPFSYQIDFQQLSINISISRILLNELATRTYLITH